jgi:hypothetical protein
MEKSGVNIAESIGIWITIYGAFLMLFLVAVLFV